jgi:APA family basic amino acid/polyamine antiporter
MNFGGDVQNARRIMPKAIILGMLVVLVLYLLVCFAFENILGFHQLAETKTPAADVMKMLMGENAQMVLSVAMFLGVMAYVNVSLMSNPRVYYAMSKDGVLPQIFGRVNEKTQTQEVSLILFTQIILITYYFSSSVEALLEYVMFFDSIAFITAAASIFIFRSREAKNNLKYDGFKMWGYPVLPILFILIYASIVTSIFMSNAFTAFVGLGLFLLGLPLYYFLRRIINSAENEK